MNTAAAPPNRSAQLRAGRENKEQEHINHTAATLETQAAASYAPRPIRHRRTKDEMEGILGGLYLLLKEDHPMTVRQVFYQATTRGLIDKTEADYKGTVVRLLSRLRRKKLIPFNWIADNTRWMRKARICGR